MAASEQVHYDDEDVPAALAKTDTADGSGFESEDDLPESDFDGFASYDVEADDETEENAQ